MAASSAAFNIEIIAYDVLNSYQSGLHDLRRPELRCRQDPTAASKTMYLCLIEDFIALCD